MQFDPVRSHFNRRLTNFSELLGSPTVSATVGDGPYRVHPTVDQIADNHAAILARYGGRPSTRYRDLVDLALITLTQTVEANPLETALVSEHRRRGTDLSVPLSLPSDDWHVRYRRIAETVPDFEILDAEEAVRMVRRLVDPVIEGLRDATWDPGTQEWRRR